MKDLTKGNIYKTFLSFGIPLVLSGLLSQLYTIVDTAIAGKFIGENALAAIGATSPLISLVQSIFWGFGVGLSVYVARLYGAEDYSKLKKSVYSGALFIMACCLTFSIILMLSSSLIIDLLKVEQSLRKDALIYFLIITGGNAIILMTNYGLYIMTSVGIGSFPFIMSLLTTVINITLNIVTVTVFKWGVAGLAISTIIAALVVVICYFIKFNKCLKELGVDKEKFSFDIKEVKNSFPYSIPNMLQQMIMYLSTCMISPLVNGIGLSASASYTVINNVVNLNSTVFFNSNRTINNYTAQCIGHGRYDKIKKGVLPAFIQNVALVTPLLILCVIFNEEVCNIFLKENATELTKQYSYDFTRNFLPFIYFFTICNLFHGFFRGVKATAHLFITTAFSSVVKYVASLILIKSYGIYGFFMGWVISWILESILCVALYFIGLWNPLRKLKTNE
ncbi:MAG: hypothetical protein IKL82_06255 [Clostridia bacterium]|nr:hypothetical protein [Clostridia bacterium]